MSFFTCSHLSTGYGARSVIRNLSFQIPVGCLTGILGANGSGKTTLMKSICGIHPHSGGCSLSGTTLDRLSAREAAKLISYIPQRSGITIDIAVIDVVLMGFNPHLKLLEQPTSAMRTAAIEALAAVGLAGREEENYLHLSEGQKQLCILARTLVSSGRLLLLDEPESALDFRYRYRMLDVIRRWISSGERCALVALHDPQLALNTCDELLLLVDSQQMEHIRPRQDSLKDMERLLALIYGPVSLARCQSPTGREHLVLFREEEPT